jgi:hypothetical protein
MGKNIRSSGFDPSKQVHGGWRYPVSEYLAAQPALLAQLFLVIFSRHNLFRVSRSPDNSYDSNLI